MQLEIITKSRLQFKELNSTKETFNFFSVNLTKFQELVILTLLSQMQLESLRCRSVLVATSEIRKPPDTPSSEIFGSFWIDFGRFWILGALSFKVVDGNRC